LWIKEFFAAVLEEASVVSSGAFGQSVTFYLAGPLALKAFIDIVTADEGQVFLPTRTEINLVGHSTGGTTVLFTWLENTHANSIPLLNLSSMPSDKIKAVANYGSTLTTRNFRTNVISFEEGLEEPTISLSTQAGLTKCCCPHR
jgi:hypothetical protein